MVVVTPWREGGSGTNESRVGGDIASFTSESDSVVVGNNRRWTPRAGTYRSGARPLARRVAETRLDATAAGPSLAAIVRAADMADVSVRGGECSDPF